MASVIGNSVGPIGLGLMGFTWRAQPPPLEQAIAAMKAAVNNGSTLWNGAEFYGTSEYNTMTLLKHYFTRYPEDADKVTIIIKGGSNVATMKPSQSPEDLRKSIDNILTQLEGKKKLDIFGIGRRDRSVPFDQTLNIIKKEYIDTGKIGAVSLSECSVETIEEAVKHVPIAAAEVELSMFTPDILQNGVAAALAKHNIPIAAYSPLGRGVLTGKFKSAADYKARDVTWLQWFPRFQGEAFAHNVKLVQQLETLAQKKGCPTSQLAIAWTVHLGRQPGQPTIIPIPGASRAEHVEENTKLIELTDEEFKSIQDMVDSFETAGRRYPEGAPMEL